MLNRRGLALLFIVSSAALLQGCSPTIKTAWSKILERCADSDINSSTTLFFGASNTLGPGSIWRKAPEAAGGGYRVRWRNHAIPDAKAWSLAGQTFTCDGINSIHLSGDAVGSFSTEILPVSGQLQTDFALAKSIKVTASKMRWNEVMEGPFEQTIAQLPDTAPIKEDLARPGRLVLYRALKVEGFDTTLSFDAPISAMLQGKYPNNPQMILPGHDTLSASFKWVNDSELHVSVPSGFYVAGQLVPFNTVSGFASNTTPIEIE
ncbi:putative lipoprotein [Bordetella avium 197N]|uniref:Lipoprotein n=2 Tax=Bordetella avium TaxID=521 RepID=Q2KW98_BORA1|nr:putative lipoprotein [Bordetella avium 197N]SUV69758.1 lipoprotein [Bordetella avium]